MGWGQWVDSQGPEIASNMAMNISVWAEVAELAENPLVQRVISVFDKARLSQESISEPDFMAFTHRNTKHWAP